MLAAVCILVVRALAVQLGFYFHIHTVLDRDALVTPALAFACVFMCFFSVVIAITKDLPDVVGDRKYNISTFATRLGVRNISRLAVTMLMACYASAVVLAFRMPTSFNTPLMVAGHVVLAAVLLGKALELDRRAYVRTAIDAFYKGIWQLFYACVVRFTSVSISSHQSSVNT